MLEGQPKRGRGRPRKYPPKTAGDFESTKYDVFFTLNNRAAEEGISIDMPSLVQEVFHFKEVMVKKKTFIKSSSWK